MTTEEVDFALKSRACCRKALPEFYRSQLPTFYSREWRLFNLLPSFGLIGNRGFAVAERSKPIFGRRKERLIFINEADPVTV